MSKTGINWDEQPLGEVNDCELARRLGVTSVAVRLQRIKRGIPTAQRQHAPTFEWFCRQERERGKW